MENDKKPWEIHHDEADCEEGGMALGFLQRTQSMIGQVQELIDVDDAIPAWVTSKLTSVYEDMSDVHAYMTQLDKFYNSKSMSETKRSRKKEHPKTLKVESLIRKMVRQKLEKS